MRRLIESSSFPLKELSELSAAEKMRRKGHIQTFHIWWARRPLASTRATLMASLIPDPLDERWSMELMQPLAIILQNFLTRCESQERKLTAGKKFMSICSSSSPNLQIMTTVSIQIIFQRLVLLSQKVVRSSTHPLQNGELWIAL